MEEKFKMTDEQMKLIEEFKNLARKMMRNHITFMYEFTNNKLSLVNNANVEIFSGACEEYPGEVCITDAIVELPWTDIRIVERIDYAVPYDYKPTLIAEKYCEMTARQRDLFRELTKDW